MKMHQKVNQAFTKVNLLMEIIETIRREVKIPAKKYMFSTSFHMDKPRVSAWEYGFDIGATNESAEFDISEDTVSLINKGRYYDEAVLEMLNIIQDWLQTEIS